MSISFNPLRRRVFPGLVAGILLLAGLPATAAEMALLRNGFSIRNDRHEIRDSMTRLYFAGQPDNFVEIPTSEILRFETVESPVPPSAAPAPADSIDTLASLAGNRNNIDPDLITSVIRAESGFNFVAVSPKGAQGLMQLMPETSASLGVRNPMDPADNVEAGTRYLRGLLVRYHNDLLLTLAAYNAGPERVEQYKGVPPFRETRSYITRIVLDFNRKKITQQKQQATGNPASEKNSAISKNASVSPAPPVQ
jgi:soluble lytic murein transglycosylase-like protein